MRNSSSFGAIFLFLNQHFIVLALLPQNSNIKSQPKKNFWTKMNLMRRRNVYFCLLGYERNCQIGYKCNGVEWMKEAFLKRRIDDNNKLTKTFEGFKISCKWNFFLPKLHNTINQIGFLITSKTQLIIEMMTTNQIHKTKAENPASRDHCNRKRQSIVLFK